VGPWPQGQRSRLPDRGEIPDWRRGETAQTLNQPLRFYRRVDAKTQPVGFIDAQLAQWALETEIPRRARARRAPAALHRRARLRGGPALGARPLRRAAQRGLPGESPAKEGEAILYIIRIRQLRRAEAQALPIR
jgi:hypothetical protein